VLNSIFILCVCWIAYVYIGYPILVFMLGKIINRQPRKSNYEPRVTILIPAFNEVEHIAETIENKLHLLYPKEKIEIIVISDESNDGTDDVVRAYSKQGVKLLRQVPRQGKTSGLNLAMSQASGDIVVFSDANSIYDKDALRNIVENFSDPKIGYVTGKMVYINSTGAIIGDGCGAYMRYENLIRKYESKLNSVVGVDGGIDAVRKKLYRPMNADQLPDFVLPLNVVEQGYRVVYEEQALLKEEALTNSNTEYKMRVRVSLRALWALLDKRALFNPIRFPLFSWELFSHKLLRYLVFIPQASLIVLNALLITAGTLYILFAVLQTLVYLFAYFGYLAEKNKVSAPFYISLPHYFVVVNSAAAQAFFMFLRGKKVVLWKPRSG